MDLDMITNGSTIKNSINLLNSEKISWIVLGYSTNKTLNVIETGNDSFEDMFEEFDSNKIMYGFATVIDPNTKLKKNVFIHWQGEAASQSMKTMSVQHANVIRDICKPVHVSHVARSEQDLDLKEIMTKVANASGSNYSCHIETKQMFQKQPSVKSEENTAANVRLNRLKELSSLESVQKESAPKQNIGTNYEKVNAMSEIKNLRTKTFDESPPSKPVGANYKKIDAAKEIKSSTVNPSREHLPYKSLATTYDRVDASKEIKSFKSSAPANEHVGSSYKRINPEEEFKSLNLQQKTMFESKAAVQSENNTAQRAREERQKELTSLFSKKNSCDVEEDQKVGTNYTRTNPVAEINKLRRASITNEEDDVFSRPTGNYKKINPDAEMKNLRRSSSSETSEPVSPNTNYKKINPAEEIKKLRSKSTFTDVRLNNTGYKKINPIEEITFARKMSESAQIEVASRPISTKTVSPVKQNEMVSARKTFENVHKKDEVHKPQNSPLKKQESTEVIVKAKLDYHPIEANTPKKNESRTSRTPLHSSTEMARAAPIVTTSVIKKTAEAQFAYEATDNDEISFAEGEIIQDIEMIDDDWWVGVNAAGEKGMFPSNYVMSNETVEKPKEIRSVIVPEPKLEPQQSHDYKEVNSNTNNNNNQSRTITNTKIEHPPLPQLDTKVGPTAVALYDYEANDGDEISFDVGEILQEIEQIDDGWWIGVNVRGQKGMFPSNFVELRNTEEDPRVQSTVSPKSVPISSPLTPSLGGPGAPRSVTVRAVYEYSAQDDDEVSFGAGDMLCNVTVVDDGWWEGEISGGKRGLFPSNYVETV